MKSGMCRFFLRSGFALPIALLVCIVSAPPFYYGAAPSTRAQHWVGSWASAPMADPSPLQTPNFANMTLRQIVRPSIAGRVAAHSFYE